MGLGERMVKLVLNSTNNTQSLMSYFGVTVGQLTHCSVSLGVLFFLTDIQTAIEKKWKNGSSLNVIELQ